MTTEHLKGSCLCGAVQYTVEGEAQRFYHCHCSRCRKATGTGHASNLLVKGALAWAQGEELIASFKVPEAERFTNTFCSQCGARLPRPMEALGMVFVPAGSLDSDTKFVPQARIFMDSCADWSCTAMELPVFAEYADNR